MALSNSPFSWWGDKFLFDAGMFTASDIKGLMETAWNKKLFRSNDIARDKKYKTYSLISSKFDRFKSMFIKTRDEDKAWEKITDRGEQFYKLMFDTLKELYNF